MNTEQPLDIPITYGFDQRRLVGRVSFPDTEESRLLIKLWAKGGLSLSRSVLTVRDNPDNPLEEKKLVLEASFVPVIVTHEDDRDES